ncbi:hypothetical protein BU14_0275s0018 [Porphyra umbilicalis]|uniref:Uncharacterized protein n=1 Tax=Porphyra umbilicalis TaxID=2786 RepID=A0A1X6P1B2_PORUM|nr:hypothetical protein BU14_0275s0018 [Porphyra umbilicalis]|eukprot:OSX74659.1 hypothetical protein BU14_0275s0018 [Porphyra umbilicalis]
MPLQTPAGPPLPPHTDLLSHRRPRRPPSCRLQLPRRHRPPSDERVVAAARGRPHLKPQPPPVVPAIDLFGGDGHGRPHTPADARADEQRGADEGEEERVSVDRLFGKDVKEAFAANGVAATAAAGATATIGHNARAAAAADAPAATTAAAATEKGGHAPRDEATPPAAVRPGRQRREWRVKPKIDHVRPRRGGWADQLRFHDNVPGLGRKVARREFPLPLQRRHRRGVAAARRPPRGGAPPPLVEPATNADWRLAALSTLASGNSRVHPSAANTAPTVVSALPTNSCKLSSGRRLSRSYTSKLRCILRAAAAATRATAPAAPAGGPPRPFPPPPP